MSPTLDAFLRSGRSPPAARRRVLSAAIYVLAAGSTCAAATHRWHTGQASAFLGGLAVALSRFGFADRAVFRTVAASPHVAALAADDGRAAAVMAGRTLLRCCAACRVRSAVHWVAPLLRWRAFTECFCALTHPAVALPLFVAADVVMARPGDLRDRFTIRCLALRATRVFSRHGAAVLVSGRPSVSEPAALVILAAGAVSAFGRRAEHGAGGFADVRQSRAVSVLSPSPAASAACRRSKIKRRRASSCGCRARSSFLPPLLRHLDPTSCRPWQARPRTSGFDGTHRPADGRRQLTPLVRCVAFAAAWSLLALASCPARPAIAAARVSVLSSSGTAYAARRSAR